MMHAHVTFFVQHDTPPANCRHIDHDNYSVSFDVPKSGTIALLGRVVDLREALNGALEALDAAMPSHSAAEHYARLADEAGR